MDKIVEKYKFELLPAYSKYKSVAILNQNGATISFLIPYYEKQKLKRNLKKAFYNYLNFVKIQEDCPEDFKKEARVKFVYGSKDNLKNTYHKKEREAL